MQNPVYRPNQTSSRGKQTLRDVPDVWELGYENISPEKGADGKPKEIQKVIRPVNDPNVISNFDYQVDIIVPFHGQYEKVTRLVESIYQCTRSNYFTLTLVDDASPNEAFIQKVFKNAKKSLKAIRLRDQRGFAGAAKVAFERTESPYVCIVNSDCVVKDLGWLRAMGESLLRSRGEGVKMVSPKTNNPTVMGCDSKFEAQYGEKPQYGVSNEANDIVLDQENHLSMYCIMCHRELFRKIGFIKEYPFGYYEDEEFAHRMRSHGYKQAVCGSSWIYHEGGSTIKYLWRKNPQIRLVMEKENRERCINDMKQSGS